MPRSEVFNREEVLEKVRDLFWSQGYHGTSISDLVETTGLNRSSLYNSFGNKMLLYKTVLIQYQEENQAIFKEAIQRAENPKEAIQNIFQNFINEIMKDLEGRGCFSLNCKSELSRSNAPIKEYLQQMDTLVTELLSSLVQESQDAGFVNTFAPSEHYGRYLFNSYQGLRMTGIFVRNREHLEYIVLNTLRVLR